MANFDDRFSGLPVELPDYQTNLQFDNTGQQEAQPAIGASPQFKFVPVNYNPFHREQPEGTDPATNQLLKDRIIRDTGANKRELMDSRLFGINGQERFQTFPERIVRSVGNIVAGNELPYDPATGQYNVEGAIDVASLMGGAPLGMKSGVASLGSGGVRRMVPVEGNPFSSSTLLSDTQKPGLVIAANKPAPAFYSAVEKAVDTIQQPKMTGQQWLGTLVNKPGVKAEEMGTIGLDQFLKSKANEPVTKAEVQGFVKDNGVRLQEVNKGKTDLITKPNEDEPHILEVYRSDDPHGEHSGMVGEIIKSGDRYIVNVPELQRRDFASPEQAKDFIAKNTDIAAVTKYHNYQLPGGTNYREKLFTLPIGSKNEIAQRLFKKDYNELQPQFQDQVNLEAENPSKSLESVYKSSHWDEPNVIAHGRFNDREIPIEHTPEQKAALQAHENAQPELDKIRNEQNKVAIQIQKTSAPLEAMRRNEIIRDVKSGKLTKLEGLNKLEEYISHPDLLPLQNKLTDLRAQEDALRKSLPEKPMPKTAKSLHIEEIQSDFLQAHRTEQAKIVEAVNKDFDGIADRMVKAGVIKKVCD